MSSSKDRWCKRSWFFSGDSSSFSLVLKPRRLKARQWISACPKKGTIKITNMEKKKGKRNWVENIETDGVEMAVGGRSDAGLSVAHGSDWKR